MKEPIDHIRRPLLPWRDSAPTECGRDDGAAITREEYFSRLKEYGQRRTAIMTCSTCASTAERWKSWEQDPREALGREIEWETGRWRSKLAEAGPLERELIAIAALIEKHRDEFDALVREESARDDWLKRKELAKKEKDYKPSGSWFRVT